MELKMMEKITEKSMKSVWWVLYGWVYGGDHECTGLMFAVIRLVRLNRFFRLVKSLIKQLYQTLPIIIYLWRFDLYHRSSSDVYSILPILATVVLLLGKKSEEHKTEVETVTNKPFIRSRRASSLLEQNKSALTDHASHDNHVINSQASVVLGQGIGEKHKMDQRSSIYCERRSTIDESRREQLHTQPHVQPISCHITTLPWQELEEELNKLLLMKISDRDWNVKGK